MSRPTSPRKSISKRIRFEIFKRDKFRCVYCGAVAPDVVLALKVVTAAETIDEEQADDTASPVRLHVDHVAPRALGGPDDLFNFVTACEDCNLGKGARAVG